MFSSKPKTVKARAVARRGWLLWSRAGAVFVALVGRRSVRLGLAVIVFVASLWLMLAPLADTFSGGAVLPPELAESSLSLDIEGLRSVINSRAGRTEQPAPSLGQFGASFTRSPVLPAPTP